MKELTLLTWLTQLGLSVALPLAGFVWLSVWLRQRYALGNWIVILGVVLGLYCAIYNGIQSLKALNKLQEKWHSETKNKKKSTHAVSYNDHD